MRYGAATAAALLVLAGCARCSRPPPPPPERFLPPDAPSAVVVPVLRAAQEQVGPLSRTALAFPIAADLGPALSALRDQLGFDPLDPKGTAQAGLDPARGAAIALDPGAPPLLVLPAGDGDRLGATVARLARDRLGASQRATLAVNGVEVTVFRPADGAPAALSLAIREGSALIVPGAGGPARIAAAATRPAGASLAGAAPFARARAALGPAALLAYVPPASPAWARAALVRDGVAVGATGSATRVSARAVLLLAPDRREFWRSVVAPGAAASREDLARMPPDAFLVGRFDGDVAAVARRVLPLAAAAGALRRAGIDLEREALALLAPGVAAALRVAPTFQVSTVSRATDLVASDPFQLAHLSAVLHVKDAGAAAALLDRLARAGGRAGISVQREGSGAPPRWRIAHRGATLDVALDGERLLVAGGAGRLQALIAAGAPPYTPPTDAARTALGTGAAGAVLDPGRLVASFRALPQEAYGTGPDAFVMRSLVDRVIDPASRLVAASVRLDLAEAAATIDLTVEARPPESAEPSGAQR